MIVGFVFVFGASSLEDFSVDNEDYEDLRLLIFDDIDDVVLARCVYDDIVNRSLLTRIDEFDHLPLTERNEIFLTWLEISRDGCLMKKTPVDETHKKSDDHSIHLVFWLYGVLTACCLLNYAASIVFKSCEEDSQEHVDTEMEVIEEEISSGDYDCEAPSLPNFYASV